MGFRCPRSRRSCHLRIVPADSGKEAAVQPLCSITAWRELTTLEMGSPSTYSHLPYATSRSSTSLAEASASHPAVGRRSGRGSAYHRRSANSRVRETLAVGRLRSRSLSLRPSAGAEAARLTAGPGFVASPTRTPRNPNKRGSGPRRGSRRPRLLSCALRLLRPLTPLLLRDLPPHLVVRFLGLELLDLTETVGEALDDC
jgi:hypothetical protein